MTSKISNLGIVFSCKGDPRILLDSARRAEQAGFATIWLPEVQDVDAFAMAGALSVATNRIKIGTGITNSSLRLPTLVAMSAATLSELSSGRFILGLGAGELPMNYTNKNPLNTPKARLSETVQIVRGCLSQPTKPFHFEGYLYQVNGFAMKINPTNRTPIYVAGMGPKMIEMAARYADGLLMMLPDLEYLRASLQKVRETLKERALSTSAFVIACYLVTVVSDDQNEAVAGAKSTVAHYCTVPSYRKNFERLGFSKELELIKRSREEGGPTKAAESVPLHMAEKLIVFGSSEECVKKITKYQEAGISHPIIYPSSYASTPFPERIDRAIEQIGPFLLK